MFSFAKKFVDRFEVASHNDHDSYYQTFLSRNNNGHGLRVLHVAADSAASRLGFEPWFDYIVAINNHELPMKFPLNSHSFASSYSVASDGSVNYGGEAQALEFRQVDLDLMIQELATIAAGPHKTVDLEVWSAKGGVSRTVTIELHPEPKTDDIPEGADPEITVVVGKSRFQTLGLTLQPQHLTAASHVWKILNIHAGSPADRAQLVPYSDYIIGCDSAYPQDENGTGLLVGGSEALLSRTVSAYYAHHNSISQDDSVPILLYVYNHDYDCVRPVTVHLSRSWSPGQNRGILGCDVGYGLLHRLPEVVGKFDTQEKLEDIIFENPEDVSYVNSKNAMAESETGENMSVHDASEKTKMPDMSEMSEIPSIPSMSETISEVADNAPVAKSSLEMPKNVEEHMDVVHAKTKDPETRSVDEDSKKNSEIQFAESGTKESDSKALSIKEAIDNPLDGADFFNQLGDSSLGNDAPTEKLDSSESHSHDDVNELNKSRETPSQSACASENTDMLSNPEDPNKGSHSDVNEKSHSDVNEKSHSDVNEKSHSDVNEKSHSDPNEKSHSDPNEKSHSDPNEKSHSDFNKSFDNASDLVSGVSSSLRETSLSGDLIPNVEKTEDKAGEVEKSSHAESTAQAIETPEASNPPDEELGDEAPASSATINTPEEKKVDKLFREDPTLDEDFLESPEFSAVSDSHVGEGPGAPQGDALGRSDMTEIALTDEEDSSRTKEETKEASQAPPPPVFSPIKPSIMGAPRSPAYNAPSTGSSGLIAPAKVGRKKRHHGPANISNLTAFMNEELSKSKATDVNYNQVDDADVAPPPMHKK